MKESFVLQNAKTIEEEKVDVVIEDGKIAEIENPGCGRGQHLYDYSHVYLSSGWIDLHVHAFPEFDPYGDEIDEIGIKQGVTTVVDAGSCGADRISDLKAGTEHNKTNLYAFLNISRIGLQRVDELSNLTWIDQSKAVQAVKEHNDIIVGLKARMSSSVVGDSGIEPLLMARSLSRKTSLPLMVHIGSAPPNIEEVLSLLEEGDVITHYLNAKPNNLFDKEGCPLNVLTEALDRGVYLDVGHGTDSFSFKIAETAKQHHIGPGTISTDIYRGNRLNGPVYSMANVLSKFLYLGYSLKEAIKAVTTHAAGWLQKPELGRIKVGDAANLTLFTVQNKPVTLVDAGGEKRVGEKKIEVEGVVVNGELITC